MTANYSHKAVVYRFGEFELDPARRTLCRPGEVIRLTPRAFQVLHLFVCNAGALFSRDDIIDRLWPGRLVSHATIDHYIQVVRNAVDDVGPEKSFLVTIPQRGFRFMISVDRVETSPAARYA
jgi:DNA-binding winged helix-turn-helix (wHTH) protein